MATDSGVKQEAVATEQHGSHTHLPEGAVEAHHPSDKQYVMIALILAAVTAVEVLLYYFEAGFLNTPILLLLALVKFIIVVAYFMHLKFDTRVVRRLFVMGVVLATAVYLAALATFHVYPWDSNREQGPVAEGSEEAETEADVAGEG